MEDEVTRLQEEWAAVLQEVQQASNENLVLREILMLSLSHPTRAQDGSGATSFPRPGQQMQHGQAQTIDPKSHFRLTVDHVELSTSTCTDVTSPRFYFEELAPIDCSHEKEIETFDFWPPISTSHEENRHPPGLQNGTAEELDRKNFASFTSLSHGPTDRLDTGHYMDLEPALSATDFMFSAHEPYLGTVHGQFDRPEPSEYYGMNGYMSLEDASTRTHL